VTPLPSDAWLGLLGGGQLGRMFTHAAQSLGHRVLVLDPDPSSPAGAAADEHLCADYLDGDALDTLARRCAAFTTEFENVPAEALARLSAAGPVSPSADAVAIAQDRAREKTFFTQAAGLATVPWRPITSEVDARSADATLFPAILKTARLGYDGKGQRTVHDAAGTVAAWHAFGGVPCVLEQRVPLDAEVSVVVARGFDGASAVFPVAENRHVDGILDTSIVPARVDPAIAQAARDAARRVADALDYHGVLCVEFFVSGGRLLANEMAPRPHNSGHWSVDGAVTSQFEQQARVLCRLPLGDASALAPSVMVNLLGDLWAAGPPDFAAVLADAPRAKLVLYGKRAARPGRKMGHLTVVGGDDPVAIAARLRHRLQVAATAAAGAREAP
jgi:5-(carboxyamino)imidazole ribonucleotide synthase